MHPNRMRLLILGEDMLIILKYKIRHEYADHHTTEVQFQFNYECNLSVNTYIMLAFH